MRDRPLRLEQNDVSLLQHGKASEMAGEGAGWLMFAGGSGFGLNLLQLYRAPRND